MPYTEQDFENAIIELMRDNLSYDYVYGPNIIRDYRSPLYEQLLLSSLCDINPKLSQDAINEAIYKLKNFESVQLLQKNCFIKFEYHKK